MKRRQVIFILSLPRSGSTLLGHLLGALPAVCYSGEIPAPLQKGYPIQCRYCGDDPCPIWGGVLTEDFVRACHRNARRGGGGGGTLRPTMARIWGRIFGDYQPPGAIFDRLFEQCSDTQVIVDSSKILSWVNWNRRADLFDVKYLFLLRDLRGIVASMQRTRNQPTTQIIRRVSSSLRNLQRYVEVLPPEKVLTVRYEQLSEQPEVCGRDVCDFLDIPYDARMLEFSRYPSHIMGGNYGPLLQCLLANGKSQNGISRYVADRLRESNLRPPLEIRADDRWKHELTASTVQNFERVAGATNRSLGYS